MSNYTLTPCEHTGEVMLTTTCERGAALARALARRTARPQRDSRRYYFTRAAAKQWQALYEGGWHPVRQGGRWLFTRDPKPVSRWNAFRIAVRHTHQCPPSSPS